MPHAKRHWAWDILIALWLALWLAPFGFTQGHSRAHGPSSEPSDEAALRAVVEKFLAAYGQKDLSGVLALWSEKAPDLATHERSLRQQFVTEDLGFGSPAISRVDVRGERASLRLTAEVTAVDLKSKEKREERLARNFEFVKEGGEWKVWRYAAAEGDLAEALIKAGSGAEREALLAEEKDLVTARLVQALLGQRGRLLYQADYSQALTICRLAHTIAERIGDRAGVAAALNAIGGVYNLQGDFAEALEHYRKSLALNEAAGDKLKAARVLGDIGSVHRQQGDYLQALEHYRKSLTLMEAVGTKRDLAFTLAGVGHIHRMQGDYVQALDYYRKSLALSEATGDKANIAGNLSHIGNVHSLRGDYDLALECYQRNLRQLEGSGHKPGLAVTLGNIGDVHRLQGNFAEALEDYRKTLALSEAMGDKAMTAQMLNRIGMLHRAQSNSAQAAQFAERAAALAGQIGSRETLWQAHVTAGRAYLALEQPGPARRSFEQAIAVIETLRTNVAGGEQEQQRFFESRVSPYLAMAELLIAQDNAAEALVYAERARARVLLDVLYSGRSNVTKAMTAEEQEQERRLNDRLVSLNTQIYRENLRPQPDPARAGELNAQLQKARLDFEAFETGLYAAHPELRTRRGEAPPLRLEEAGALLPDARTALLEFVVAGEKVYLFVLTKDPAAGVTVYPLGIEQKDLAARTERFCQMLSTLDNRFPRPARELYDLLLGPAGGQLRGKTRLVIVPDGPLWGLPFQALQTPQGRYLVEHHTIFYAPSLTVLREMTNARGQQAGPFPTPTLFALGNPALARAKAASPSEGLDPLPEAERQVRALGRIYGPDRSKVYVGTEAREERFKSEAAGYRILHLATHGLLNDRSPMYSHLLLAQTGEGETEDGLLEAWEIMKLDLRADLAVLSACETARGRVGKGEGTIGLTWALFVAGVPTTVVSQWKVRSDSTAELMVEFHRQLQTRPATSSGRSAVGAALRAAALKLMGQSRYRHPFHWAGFIVVGDGY